MKISVVRINEMRSNENHTVYAVIVFWLVTLLSQLSTKLNTATITMVKASERVMRCSKSNSLNKNMLSK
jgi:hypothetical protein